MSWSFHLTKKRGKRPPQFLFLSAMLSAHFLQLDVILKGLGPTSSWITPRFGYKVNPSTPRPEGQGLPSTRAQAEGIRVDPEPRFSTPSLKTGLSAAERVKDKRAVAQTHRLPFDRPRASGGVLKSFDFSVHAELVES